MKFSFMSLLNYDSNYFTYEIIPRPYQAYRANVTYADYICFSFEVHAENVLIAETKIVIELFNRLAHHQLTGTIYVSAAWREIYNGISYRAMNIVREYAVEPLLNELYRYEGVSPYLKELQYHNRIETQQFPRVRYGLECNADKWKHIETLVARWREQARIKNLSSGKPPKKILETDFDYSPNQDVQGKDGLTGTERLMNTARRLLDKKDAFTVADMRFYENVPSTELPDWVD